MPDDRADKDETSSPDQGRAGWEQVGRQDQLHWSDQRPRNDETVSAPPEQDPDRNANLDLSPRDDDGFAEYQAHKDDDRPKTPWDQDDFRRTDFAGSLDGTSHTKTQPNTNGQPPHLLRPD